MIEIVQGLGYGIIGLAVLIGVGIVIMQVMGSNVAGCSTGWTYGNGTGLTETCCLDGASTCTGANSTNPSTATSSLITMRGYLGTTSGGLASWIPIVIVLVIGLAFLGAFIARKSNRS